ncbi:MAG: hypothetical protein ACE5LV_04350, partial [Candidatus Aminicenantales bacterium]
MQNVMASVRKAISFSWFVGFLGHHMFMKNADVFFKKNLLRASAFFTLWESQHCWVGRVGGFV